MSDVVTRAMGNFSTNGALRGPIGFFNPDTGELLAEADRPNWRHPGVVEEAAAKVTEEMALDFPECEMTLERAIKGLRGGLREARREQDAAPDRPDDEVSGSQTDRLLVYVGREKPTLFIDEYGDPYISPTGDGTEVYRINSRATKRWLAHLMDTAEGKAPSGEALNSCILTLEARAGRTGETYQLDVRTAWRDGVIWYDLGRSAVRVFAGGWEICDKPPILFRRFPHQHAQVTPVTPGDFSLLQKYLRFSPNDDDDRLLASVSLITDFTAGISVVGKDFSGPEGSAKTTTARVLVSLVDPSAVPTVRRVPKQDALAQRFEGWRVAAFDNAGDSFPDWLQDAIAAAITGDGDIRRELYTTKDTSVMSFMRSVVITGITVPLTNADVLDRFLLLRLSRISEEDRMPEDDFWKAFNADKPAILGGVFDVLSRALAILPTVNLTRLQRMASWTRLGWAISEALGDGGARFLTAYKNNIQRRRAEAIAADLVAQAVLILMEPIAEESEWRGTPTKLKNALDSIAEGVLGVDLEDKRKAAEVWPTDTTRLGHALTRIAETLDAEGVSFRRDHDGRRRIYIFKKVVSSQEVGKNSVSSVTALAGSGVDANAGNATNAEIPTFRTGSVIFDGDEPTPCAGCKMPLAIEQIDRYDDAGDPLCFGCSMNEEDSHE